MKERTKITLEEVRHIAHLSRLNLTREEEEKFTRELDKILEWVEKLREVDTQKVPPTTHVVPLKNVFREDRERKSIPSELILSLAPEKKYNHFRVPRVI